MHPYSPVGIQSLPLSHNNAIIFGIMAVELDEVDIQLLTGLKETGVIRVISAQLDPAAAGFPLQVYVTAMLARHDPRSSNVFDDMIRALPQVIAADNVAGETDYLLTVVARDVAELQTVLASLATRGGQRLGAYLRPAGGQPPPPLPPGPPAAPPPPPAPPR